MAKRLLLISNSTTHPTGYLDHCEPALRDFLQGVRRILFVPFALHACDAYAATARKRVGRMGFELDSLHDAEDPVAAVVGAEAIFTGGGNTFRLLDALYGRDLLEPMRQRVEAGAPYVGTSAGSNVACPTIKTTNDMPIVQPPSFDALNLVPFNLNPHYIDPDPDSTHKGETRETRIREFHEMNEPAVVGIREGSMLHVEGPRMTLEGTTGAKLFRKGRDPEEFDPGAELDFLLQA